MAPSVRAGMPLAAMVAAAAALLLGATLALYGNALRYPLVFDDEQLTDDFIRRFATMFAFDLRWASYATFGAIRQFAGPDWWWQRLANLLAHAAVATMLFGLLFRLQCAAVPSARDGEGRRRAAWLAFFGALLFLLHPAAVYAVAYLIQRSILLATFWSLACLWLFLEALAARSSRLYLAAALAYLLAVYSKEHAVMLPAVAAAMALLVRQPRRADLDGLVRELALPLALFAAAGVLVVLQLKGVLGAPYERFAVDAASQLSAAPARDVPPQDLYLRSVVNQGWLYFRYLVTWIAPWPGLMSIDVRPSFPAASLAWPYLAGFLAWLAWPLACTWMLLKGGRIGLAGLALLAPWLLGLTEMVTVRLQEMFVLYRSYLWMALLPAALPLLCARWRTGPAIAALGTAALLCVPASLNRLATFASPLALWSDAVDKLQDGRPYADRTWRNRGWAHYQVGHYPAALADFNQAIALDPANPKSWFQRATLNLRLGRTELAAADFDRVLSIAPDHIDALGRRCLAYLRLQRLAEARVDCTRAAQGNPADPDNHVTLGMVYALEGDAQLAERSYRKALSLAPRSGMAHYQYGVLLRGMGRTAEARAAFGAACEAGITNACTAPAGR